MAFVKLNSRSYLKYSSSSIKISFYIRKNTEKCILLLNIGDEIANKIDIKDGDRIMFSYDEHDRRKWIIEKSTDKNKGFKLRKSSSDFLLAQITWDVFKPSKDEIGMHTVSYEISDGIIKIDANMNI